MKIQRVVLILIHIQFFGLLAPACLFAYPTKDALDFYESGMSILKEYKGEPDQLHEAHECFDQLINKFPNSPLGYLGISRIHVINAYRFDNYYDMDEIRQQALPFAVRALELGPLLPEVHINYSGLENIFNQHRQNQELAQKYLALLPEEPETFFLIGKYLFSQSDYAKALEFFQTALDLNPKPELRLKILQRIGVLYLNKLDQPDKALKFFEQALEINKNMAEVYEYIGIAYLRLSQYQLSIENLKKSIQLYQNRMTQKYLLLARGYLFEKTDRKDEAILLLERAVSFGGEDSRLYYHLGNLYFESANYSKAYAYFKHVIDLKPNDFTDAYYFAGRSVQSLGNDDLATDYFRQYLQLNGHGPEADWIRANIPDLSHKTPID